MGANYTLAAIFLGITNVALNFTALYAAKKADSLSDALASLGFIPALILGCVSLLCMMWMYFSGAPLARGLLVAGATSILLGTVVSVIAYGTKLTTAEWALWAAIAIFYGLRFVNVGVVK